MRIELARDNYLRPNGHGGWIIRQSDLGSWARCQLQKYYDDRAANDPAAPQRQGLSATIYGSHVHYALMILEQLVHEAQVAHPEGSPERDAGELAALAKSLATFEYYWQPQNVHLLDGERIDEWLPRQTYMGLKERGKTAITDWFRIMRKDENTRLALEYQFAVPIEVGGVTHTLTGTVDKLRIGKHVRKPYLSLDDFKTGKQPSYLRWNTQGTAYGYASTKREFWLGWPESGMGHLETFDQGTVSSLETMFKSWGYRFLEDCPGDLPIAARRFRWINMQENKIADGGWRTTRDYNRLHLAIDAYVRACEHGTYSVSNTGEVCLYCPHKAHCGGIGLPHEKSGAP